MTGRGIFPVALIAAVFPILLPGCQASTGKARPGEDTKGKDSSKKVEGDSNVSIHYLEIVSNDVDALCATYEQVHGLDFGSEDPDLGQARVAVRPDGSLLGVRKPLAEHEQPTMRTYLEVDDIEKAVKKAQEGGAMIAYPPTKQGKSGTWAIFIQGEVQHGLWQR